MSTPATRAAYSLLKGHEGCIYRDISGSAFSDLRRSIRDARVLLGLPNIDTADDVARDLGSVRLNSYGWPETYCDCCGLRDSFGCGHSSAQRAAARRHH